MKTLTELAKREILAPIIADQIAEEALNENYNTISEIIFKIGVEKALDLLSAELQADYYDLINADRYTETY